MSRPAISTEKTLQRLFLSLFLRGRSARGIKTGSTPTSVGTKLFFTLAFYVLMGLVAILFLKQPVFPLAIYLHAMTFLFTGTFIAASAGEMLFNKEEADILLHRPVTPRQLLWAKVTVLIRVSLWLGFAFNLAGLVVGVFAPGGHWWFPAVHMLSVSLETLFCTSLVVVVYQLCLRWFGREKLDGVMTMAQVLVAIGTVLAAQVLPRMIGQLGGKPLFDTNAWWVSLIPPAWFAGIDDALAGSGAMSSWLMAGGAVAATAIVVALAFGVLARDFGAGLQKIGEAASIRPSRPGRRRFLHVLVGMPPLKWWLREPVERASFLLTAAYLVRDRDVKLRVYPSLAPILIMPFFIMFQSSGRSSDGFSNGMGVAFASAFLALTPAMALNILQFSQQWQAADVFRAAPMPGPASLCHGARKATILLLGIPLAALISVISWFVLRDLNRLALLLPGVIALPVLSLLPCLGGHAVPLSVSSEEAKAANRSVALIVMMMVSMALSMAALVAQMLGLLWWLLAAEALVVGVSYVLIQGMISRSRWASIE